MTKRFLVLRMLSLILVLVLLLLMVGCQSKKQTNIKDSGAVGNIGDTGGLPLPIGNGNETVTILAASDFPERTESFVVKELSKRLGIKIKITEVSVSNRDEKVKILVSSGQTPDIFSGGLNFSDVNDMGGQGALVPINQYIDQLPNFKKIFVDDKENNWIFKSLVAADGNLYYWPRYNVARKVNHGFLYRKDIFDKHGITEWNNTEEFYQALKKLKELYPNSSIYSSKTGSNIFKDWAFGWGLFVPQPYYNEDRKTWALSTTDPEYKNMLDFMKKLYAEGLLDKEFLTDTQASWTQKMTQRDKSFVTFDWIGRLDMLSEQTKSVIPEYNLRYANPIGSKGYIRPVYTIGQQGWGQYVSNNKNKLLSLKVLDYITSPSGTELMSMGVEGVTYKKDAEGKITYPDFPPEKKLQITDLENKFGMFIDGLYTRLPDNCIYYNYSEKEQEAQDKIVKANKIAPMQPTFSFNKEEQALIAEYQPTLEKEALVFSSKYVMNDSYGEKQWSEWLEKAKSLGEEKLLNVYIEAQKRYDSK